MKRSLVIVLCLSLSLPALASEPAPPDVVALMEARDAQAQRYVDAQALPGLLDTGTIIAASAMIFGGGLATAGAVGQTPEAALLAVGGWGLLICGGATTLALVVSNLVLDKRQAEATKLGEAQAKLDDAVRMAY